MNTTFSSFKLIVSFLIFLIFLLFCILNIFFYDIYKKDTLLILSDYEKTMQYEHSEINRFYNENIGELFFIRENIKELNQNKPFLNNHYIENKQVFGNFLKKYPYTLITGDNFLFDKDSKNEIEAVLTALELLEFRRDSPVNQYTYVSKRDFLIIYPQYSEEKNYIFYLNKIYKENFEKVESLNSERELHPVEFLSLEYNFTRGSLDSLLFSRIINNRNFLGNLYLSTNLKQIEKMLLKDEYSVDFMFFTEERELFYSNKFNINQKESIDSILVKYFQKNLEQLFSKEISDFIPLIYENDGISYLKLVSKKAFSEKRLAIAKMAILINSILFIGIFSFTYLINKYIKIDVNRINLIDYQNTVDDLTKLLNRKTVLKILSENFNTSDIYLALIDIDKFKSINDTYGHPFGDFVLIKIAKLLKVIVGDKGYVARYGGEEFIVIFIGKDFELVKTVCDRINRIIFEKGKYIIGKTISVSIGLGKKQNDTDYSTLIERADKNLYEAKNTGRNRVIYK